MRQKAVFRVMLRIVGLWLVVWSIPMVVYEVARLIDWWFRYSHGYWYLDYAEVARALVQIAIGVYLLRGPVWVVNLVVRDPGRTCLTCGYSLRGSPDVGRCPECGDGYDLTTGRSSAESGDAAAE